nr:MAG TPA: hypothetical protein [Caudoviricetes sp.]
MEYRICIAPFHVMVGWRKTHTGIRVEWPCGVWVFGGWKCC